MGGPVPEPGPESGEGEFPPESRVDAPMPPEPEEPPAVLPSETEQYQAEPTDIGMDTGIVPEPEVEGEIPAPEETTMDTTTEDLAPTTEDELVSTPETEPMVAPETTTADVESTEPQDTTESVPESEQFACPNCGSALTRDMTQCPGCAAPLVFDQIILKILKTLCIYISYVYTLANAVSPQISTKRSHANHAISRSYIG